MENSLPPRISPTPAPDPMVQGLSEELRRFCEEDRGGTTRLLVSSATPDRTSMVAGAVAVLHGLGLLERESDDRFVPRSRFARFTLESLVRILEQGRSVLTDVKEAEANEYLVDLTQALEQARVASAGSLDRVEPIHQRRIVNILLKGRQVRHGRMVDVFLHAFHPEWRQYHLIGMSKSREDQTDEELVHVTLSELLGLGPERYQIDPSFNPAEIKHRAISATNGAVTEYTFRVFRLERLEGKLRFPAGQRDQFRWFSWQEVHAGEGLEGEPIMRVTSKVLTSTAADRIPANVGDAENPRRTVRIADEILNRITYRRLILIALLFILALLCWVLVGVEDETLDRLDKLGSVFGAILGLAALILAVLALKD